MKRPTDSGPSDNQGRRVKVGVDQLGSRSTAPIPASADHRQFRLPAEHAAVMPAETVEAWEQIAPLIPSGAYLAGGTALAIHLHHRVSRDLDFFLQNDVDLVGFERDLDDAGTIAVTWRADDTLNLIFNGTKIQMLSAHGQRNIGTMTRVAGIDVASVEDIAAMKLKVILDRGELRDYFDLMMVDEAALSIEEAIGCFSDRYSISGDDQRISMVVRSLGYLDDVADDPLLPVDRGTLERFWRHRVGVLAVNLQRSI